MSVKYFICTDENWHKNRLPFRQPSHFIIIRGKGSLAGNLLGFGSFILADDDFFESGALTGSLTEIVELMSSDLGMLQNFDGSDDRGVDEEVSFNTDTGRFLSDDEGSAGTSAADGNDNAFEGLLSFLVVFTDDDHDSDSIAGSEIRNIVSDLSGGDLLD